MVKQLIKRARTGGRRQADLWPVLTKVLTNLAILTGAGVTVLYSYGFGQKSNDPLIENRRQLDRVELIQAKRQVEKRVEEIAEQLRQLEKQVDCRREE